jgi:hypothetical protein
MKLKTIIFLFFVTINASAQIIPSSCQTTDSILEKLIVDASRLALRQTYKTANTYKDSVRISPSLRKRYLDALVAVYNATALPVHDSLFNLLRIHTNPVPEVNNMNVKASPSLSWMQELYNNQAPASSPVINALMQKYNMQYSYLQSTLYDVVIFQTDTCLNLPAQAPVYVSQGAISAAPETGYNDVRNITDSLNPNFVLLDFSYGWGTCNDGCDRRRTWQIKVKNDCSVEYLGATGPSFFLNLSNNRATVLPAVVNPSSRTVILKNVETPLTISLISLDGRLITTGPSTPEHQFNLPVDLESGFYFIKLEGTNINHMERLLIE